MNKPLPISREDFLQQLERAAGHSINAEHGLFGPDSVSWRLLRESIGFLGAGRAALLQLAHPWVAQAIDQHSKTKTDPVGRFNRTFVNVFTIFFGSVDQVLRTTQSVHALHSGMQGKMSEDTGDFKAGTAYMANEAHAMLWVHATLWDTLVRMHELVYGPLPQADKDRFWQETKLFAYCFGIPEDIIPPTWNDFQVYMEQMLNSDQIAVRAVGKEVGSYLFSFDLFPGSRLLLQVFRTVTAEMLTPRLRAELGLPAPSEQTRRTFERTVKWIRRIYPWIPARLRYVPSYWEAMGRVQGKAHPDLLVRSLNRLYVGRPELVSKFV